MQVLDFLDPSARAAVEPLVELIEVSRGDDLYRIGEPADSAYVVISGLIHVRQLNAFDQQGQAVALLSSGAPAGEAALVNIERRNSTLTAVEDSRLIRLSLENFAVLKKTNPEAALSLLEFFLMKTSIRLQHCSARLSRIL
jgi:NTE family protein